MARPTKNEQEQKELFASLSDDGLDEIAKFMGAKFEETFTREDKIKALVDAKRKDITVAPVVKLPDGKEIDCPKGYAVIQIIPKTGQEWGAKSRETFFLAVQGDTCVGRRGVAVRIKEKYLEVLKNAVRIEYDQEEIEKTLGVRSPQLVERKVFAEDYQIIAHNPDLETLEKAERTLIEKSEQIQKAKAQQELLKGTLFDKLTGNL